MAACDDAVVLRDAHAISEVLLWYARMIYDVEIDGEALFLSRYGLLPLG